MIGRPLVDNELFKPLISRNYGKNTELKYRNKLLLLLAGLVGLREIELTLVTIDLFVSPTGALNEFVILPDSIARDGNERPILLSNEHIKDALEQYIKWLIQTGINTQPGKHYLGLDPTAELLVNDDLKKFSLQKRGNDDRLSPHAMNKRLDKLIQDAGLWDKGVRRLSLIRTCVIESYRCGMSVSDICITTGFSDDSISKILIMDYTAYSPISAFFIKRKETKQRRLESFKKRRRFMI
ncbi:integrase [Moritella sp. F3]|uniref:integrase n=1 Tax=Moritella sp. F3 TaxID=2718882 RepID=UPI0018E1A9B2|nr:integrase [Moritella sp. F3]GIC77176.1 hypothetical protein FMO001_19030 [Moritella sp. F1]GIC82295.1 hypothetical protein FMO003_25760 [Moritella sp. F3]